MVRQKNELQILWCKANHQKITWMQFRLRKKLSFQDFFAKLSMKKKELWDSTETNNSSMVIKATYWYEFWLNFRNLNIWLFYVTLGFRNKCIWVPTYIYLVKCYVIFNSEHYNVSCKLNGFPIIIDKSRQRFWKYL